VRYGYICFGRHRSDVAGIDASTLELAYPYQKAACTWRSQQLHSKHQHPKSTRNQFASKLELRIWPSSTARTSAPLTLRKPVSPSGHFHKMCGVFPLTITMTIAPLACSCSSLTILYLVFGSTTDPGSNLVASLFVFRGHLHCARYSYRWPSPVPIAS